MRGESVLCASGQPEHAQIRDNNSPVGLGGNELKYVAPATAASVGLQMLRALCSPDAMHPCGTVCTVYYDTPTWDRYGEKCDSDYLKSKVRVRWYLPDVDPHALLRPAFFEIKAKEGAQRSKQRREMMVSREWWDDSPLTDRRWRDEAGKALGDWLADVQTLAAVVEIRYERARFIERSTGARIALDTCIHVPRANHLLLRHRQLQPLSVAVLEIKGPVRELPASLLPLVRCGFRKQSLSKYAACVDLLQARECGASWM